MRASGEYPVEEVYMGEMAVKGNYVWCLVIGTKFKGLEGANR